MSDQNFSLTAATQWRRLDLPLLEQVATLEGCAGAKVENQAVLAATLGPDWTEQMVAAAVGRLVTADYLVAIDASTMADDDWLQIGLAERGRRAVGVWPGGEVAMTLLSVLDERISAAEDEEERARWRKVRDGAAAVGQGVLAGVLVETVKRNLVL